MWTNGPTRRGVLAGVAGGTLVPIAAASAVQEADGLSVSILGTNSPVATGDILEVTARLDNDGGDSIATNAELVVGHDPTLVDTRSVEVGPGASETIKLTFETAVVDNDQEFPIWVTAGGGADRTNVLVYADDPPLEVSIVQTNDPVTSGSVLQVQARFTNRGTSPVSQEVALIVGHDPQRVDSTTVSLDGGESETVVLEFETADVDNDQEFPVRVESDDDADERSVLVYADGPALDVSIVGTNDPVDAGEVLEVTVAIENTGETTATQDIALIVGHDPTRVDSASVSLAPGRRGSLVMEFETAVVDNDQEFPVRVESDDDADERTVLVYGTDGDDSSEMDVSFPSCTRAVVNGSFGDGDTVAASTGFYDDANGEPIYGNTIMEDWIEIGEHVDAPFSGTIVFEIGEERNVSETGDGAYVEVPDYGELGTVLTGITSPEDYATATITYSNPNAESCLREIEEGGGDGGTLEVSITGTNAPVRAGERLDVTAALENTGDESVSQEVALIVGHDPQRVDSTTVSLEGGASGTETLGYETYPAARTTEFPVQVESEDDSAEVTVEVIGTDAEPESETADDTAEGEDAADADAQRADGAEPADEDDGDAESDDSTGTSDAASDDDSSDGADGADDSADDGSTEDSETDSTDEPTDDDSTEESSTDADGGDGLAGDESDADAADADAEAEGAESSASPLLGFDRWPR